MNDVLKFSVDNVELMDNMNNSFFRKIRIKAFASGENVHTLPIDEDVLKRGAKTVYDKPILWKYNKNIDDAEGHEIDEVPCGFIKESNDNPIIFERTEDNRLFLVINALLWTRYCGRLIDIFERDDNTKDVSIEIATINDESKFGEKPKILDFVIAGITILGSYINPACKGCKADLLEFSEDKKKYLKDIKFSDNVMEIDNSKKSSVTGSWSNPRRKLFVPISNASNKETLFKEAYLVVGDIKNPIMSHFKYPHHIIKDGKLVIHTDGVMSAFSRASQQGIVDGELKKHLLKHYKELGLSQENFSEFGMSLNEYNLYFSNDINNNKNVGDLSMAEDTKKKDIEKDLDKEEDTKNEEENKDLTKESEQKEETKEEEKETKEEEKETKEEEKETKEEMSEKEEDDKGEDNKEEEKMCDAVKMQEMSEKIDKLEKENQAYMSQISAMSDYNDLKKFKDDTIAAKTKEEEMCKMNQVMSDIEKRGVNMSDEDKKTYIAKFSEFSSVEAWGNYVKAQAFDRVENIDGIVRMGLPYADNKPKSIWDNL